MRKIILGLAVSLDGYIEGPNGEIDWCFTDQDYGMAAFFKRIDSVFMGRKSYELVQDMGEAATAGFPKLKEYIFSKTLKQVKGDAVLLDGELRAQVERIRNEPGKDIWLFGGASLISAFLKAGLIDEYWLSVHPVILGGGKSLFCGVTNPVKLELVDTKTYSTGLVSLTYHPAESKG
jgi:dihydrofolate reductase